MSVMKAISPPEYIYTQEGKFRVTHEAYTFHITPFLNPPIKIEITKGRIDRSGQFIPIPSNAKALFITANEFRELISPTAQGKPAGDFRLSDVLNTIKKRTYASLTGTIQQVIEGADETVESQSDEPKPHP